MPNYVYTRSCILTNKREYSVPSAVHWVLSGDHQHNATVKLLAGTAPQFAIQIGSDYIKITK